MCNRAARRSKAKSEFVSQAAKARCILSHLLVLILFIKCMFVLSLERFTSSQFPFGVLPWICPVSFGAGPEVPHLSLRQTLGRRRLIDRTFVSVCLSLHSNRL